MTKEKAQELYSTYLADCKKTNSYNKLVNEGGEGYEREVNRDAVDSIINAGFAVNYDTGKVYDRADFDAMREAWNTHARSLPAGQKADIKAMQASTGVDYNLLVSLKPSFVA